MDLIEPDEAPGNTPEFSVSELSGAVKRTIEGAFDRVRVRGEVGRVSRPRSGHVYLDLKDDRAVINAVMWRGVAAGLQTQPEEGMEVVVSGRMTTFPGQSRYQIVIDDIRPAGVGALMAMLEKRRAALRAEGLFDPDRKSALPFLPEVIGVVTSPSGAVIRDILHRLADRFPRHVLIWPVAVQGAASAGEVARAIAGFNRLEPGGAIPRPDLLIVARGGGSVEDLWGFNEEIVVRAAAASTIPLISAVGHETDTTLIDFAADWRAPTPTAAAEKAVPVRVELSARLAESGARLTRAAAGGIEARGQALRQLARALPRPDTLVALPRQRLDVLGERLPQALTRLVERRRLQLGAAAALRPGLLTRTLRDGDARLAALSGRLAPAVARSAALRREALRAIAARLTPRPIRREVAAGRDALTDRTRRLSEAQTDRLADARRRLEAQGRLLDTLSYRETLRRGYAVVRAGDTVVTDVAAAQAASGLEIEFADGRFRVGGPVPKRGGKGGKPPEQGSLF